MRIIVYFSILMSILFQCGKKQSVESANNRTTVQRVDLRDVISQTGEVVPIVTIELKSEASGKIQKIYIKEGQKVKKNDKIVDIDPSRLLYHKKALDIDVKKKQLLVHIAKRNFDDSKRLLPTGTISERAVLDAQNQYEMSRLDYEQQLLELHDITDQLRYTSVLSPTDGVVTLVSVKEGEIAVAATTSMQGGTSLAVIADVQQLEVVSKIGEVDYVNLKVGQQVGIRPEALEGVQTRGTISFIALSAKKVTGENLSTFDVRIKIDSLVAGIVPGINVNIDFVILEKKGVIGLQNQFVQKKEDGLWVDKLVNNTVEKTQITVGATDYKYYEILKGLQIGDIVIGDIKKE